jgi:hypothetical protein
MGPKKCIVGFSVNIYFNEISITMGNMRWFEKINERSLFSGYQYLK